MEKVVVFDFDKTLTNYDTIFPFFLFCCRRKISRYILVPCYIFIKFLSKYKLISVKREKEFGLWFFCPRDIAEFDIECKKFASCIRLNDLYNSQCNLFKDENPRIVIASASFSGYLKYIFPDAIIVASTLKLNLRDKIIGITEHPFKAEKAMLLISNGVAEIEKFYTDSYNDLSTMKLSKTTYIVSKGEIIEIIENSSSLNSINYFKNIE